MSKDLSTILGNLRSYFTLSATKDTPFQETIAGNVEQRRKVTPDNLKITNAIPFLRDIADQSEIHERLRNQARRLISSESDAEQRRADIFDLFNEVIRLHSDNEPLSESQKNILKLVSTQASNFEVSMKKDRQGFLYLLLTPKANDSKDVEDLSYSIQLSSITWLRDLNTSEEIDLVKKRFDFDLEQDPQEKAKKADEILDYIYNHNLYSITQKLIEGEPYQKSFVTELEEAIQDSDELIFRQALRSINKFINESPDKFDPIPFITCFAPDKQFYGRSGGNFKREFKKIRERFQEFLDWASKQDASFLENFGNAIANNVIRNFPRRGTANFKIYSSFFQLMIDFEKNTGKTESRFFTSLVVKRGLALE